MLKWLLFTCVFYLFYSCNVWEEDDRYKQGFKKAIEGNYEQAAAIFSHLAQEESLRTSINTYLQVLGDVQRGYIKEETARELFQAFMIGRVSGDTNKIGHIKSAIQNNPEYYISYKELGNVHYYRKEYEPAIINYEHALKLDSTYFYIYYNLAITYDESGQSKNALRYYKKFIASNESSNDRYVQYAKYRILGLESFSF
jgi:tetratricopeptide (TPR) repeat protein